MEEGGVGDELDAQDAIFGEYVFYVVTHVLWGGVCVRACV
jgi:hypothetical protein